ncbi:MAG: hypothetical protein DMF98_28110, partial [Acidobacteria bacterium]
MQRPRPSRRIWRIDYTNRVLLAVVQLGVAAGALLVAQEPAQTPSFRSGVSLVLVDVVVRDRSGAAVTGLRGDDFELFEDGVRQPIVSCAFESIGRDAPAIAGASALAGAGARGAQTPLAVPSADATGVSAPAAAADVPTHPLTSDEVVPTHPLTSDEVAGHRLLTLVFDTSSMQPDEVQKAIDEAVKWVDGQMTGADLVAVAAINSSLQVLTDFTSSRERLRSVLSAFSATDGTAFTPVDASTSSADEAAQTGIADSIDQSAQELDTFNNDVRLRALKTLAEALQPIQQKKAIIYFSSGMQRSGTDNQVELRAAVNAAVRANVAIYPVDSRGLQAVVPGGGAHQASRGGLAAFTGSAAADQSGQLTAQQETLTSLASDTGGTAFTDTNSFGDAFSKVERDISSYYILGFSSANTSRDGRFRRLTVRIRNRSNLKVEAEDGYYAERDFAHTAKTDREVQLQEQLATPIPATDVPLLVTAGWFRLTTARYYVPISLVVPGSAVPVTRGKGTLDVAGFIRDERGFPVGRIRDTLTVPPAETGDGLAAKQVLYETAVTLPPGRFSVKVVVRENADGHMGTFETPLVVPELKQAPVKVSSVLLSTQLQRPTGRKSSSPLVRDGIELVPNLTHIVGRNQTLYFYYEVY